MSGLDAHPGFQRMLTQVKFLNGDLKYNEMQQDILRQWISEQGPKKMGNLFQEIIRCKDRTLPNYKLSSIYRILSEAGGVTDDEAEAAQEIPEEASTSLPSWLGAGAVGAMLAAMAYGIRRFYKRDKKQKQQPVGETQRSS